MQSIPQMWDISSFGDAGVETSLCLRGWLVRRLEGRQQFYIDYFIENDPREVRDYNESISRLPPKNNTTPYFQSDLIQKFWIHSTIDTFY